MRRFIISEQEKRSIRKLYHLSESESALSNVLNFLLPSNKKDEEDNEISSDSTSKKSNSSINQTEVKGLDSNENIVFQTLKDDGFTDESVAAIMGVIGGESGFKLFKETSYVSTPNNRIRLIFGNRVANLSDKELSELKSSDEDFFNKVYGGLYGNAPDEGYKYVGRGFNGITFKGNYKAAQDCTGISFVSNPELMEDPSNAARALSCYFKRIKDIDDFETAFQEAFRQNAGPGKTFDDYVKMNSPFVQEGIDKKRNFAKEYYKKITGKTA